MPTTRGAAPTPCKGSYAPADHGSIQLTALTRCRESHRKDEVVDGMTGKPRPDLTHNLSRPMTELREIDSFAPADAVVWAPEFRSSFLVRQELGQLMTAVQADRIITDVVDDCCSTSAQTRSTSSYLVGALL